MADDRRKSARLRTPGLKSNITDGRVAFFVAVEDISKNGIGLSQVPEGFDETVHKCFAVISAPLKDFKLVLHPRWVQTVKSGQFKKIGFQIDDPPADWVDFVESVKRGLQKKHQRTVSRHKTFSLMAVVSDGKSRYFGVIEDLSENGLRLTQVPAEFDDTAGICSAVVHSPTGDVNVSLQPCWIQPTNRGMYKTIGFRIQETTGRWQKLIEELESENGQLGFLLLDDEAEEEADSAEQAKNRTEG